MTTPKTIDDLRKALPERERRVIPTDVGTVELRAAADGVGPKIAMFVPYNRRSQDLGGFTEMIAPGFFSRSIKNGRASKHNNDIVSLWQHDPAWVLGRQANDTLTFQDDTNGQRAEAQLDGDDAMHRHFARRVERRDVTGTSFGFEVVKDEWEHRDDSITRTLIEGKISDFSPVTYPAYRDSQTEQRSLIEVAAVKLGLDVGELANLLAGVEGGKVKQDAAAELRSWVTKLTGMIPDPPVPETDWRSRLVLRERVVRGI